MVSALGAVTSSRNATMLRDAWPSTLFEGHGSLGRLPELFRDGRLELSQLLPRYSAAVRVSRSMGVRMMPAAQINDTVCASATVSDAPAMHAPYGPPFHAAGYPAADMYPQCVDGFPMPDEGSLHTIDMAPGTLVFMPRGTWHSSVVSTPSLAASIAARPPLMIESVVNQLRNLLLQEPRWRTPLYGTHGTAEQAAAAERKVDALLPDLQRIVSLLKAGHITSMAQTPAARMQSIGWESTFQRVPNVTVETLVERSLSGPAMIRLRNGSIPPGVAAPESIVAQALEPVCQWISHRHAPFSAQAVRGEFPQLPAQEILQLLIGLAGMDVIVPLWFPIVPRLPSGTGSAVGTELYPIIQSATL